MGYVPKDQQLQNKRIRVSILMDNNFLLLCLNYLHVYVFIRIGQICRTHIQIFFFCGTFLEHTVPRREHAVAYFFTRITFVYISVLEIPNYPFRIFTKKRQLDKMNECILF